MSKIFSFSQIDITTLKCFISDSLYTPAYPWKLTDWGKLKSFHCVKFADK